MAAKSYLTKSVSVEAIQWSGDNLNEVMLFCGGDATDELLWRGETELVVYVFVDGKSTGHGIASQGDWIVRDAKHRLRICKPDVFAETYVEALT